MSPLRRAPFWKSTTGCRDSLGLGKAVEYKAEAKRLLPRKRLLSLLLKRPPLARGLRNHEHRQHSADLTALSFAPNDVVTATGNETGVDL